MSSSHRRRGGNGSREPPSRKVQVSKKLSWLLRHGAEAEGVALDAGGFANLADVLANRQLRSLRATLPEVRELVRADDKQRFTLLPARKQTSPTTTTPTTTAAAAATANTFTADAPTAETNVDVADDDDDDDDDDATASDDPRDWRIRANQGHSVKVASEGLLTAVEAARGNVPVTAVHGTTHRAWAAIAASGGLRPMGRNHVHLAAGLPRGFQSMEDSGNGDTAAAAAAVAPPVISGMRNSSTVLVYVDVAKAMAAGIKFWLSDNGVILSEGNEQGLIPLEFFERVEDRTGEGILVRDGQIVKEAPTKWSVKTTGKG